SSGGFTDRGGAAVPDGRGREYGDETTDIRRVAAALRSSHDVGNDRRILRNDIYALALYELVAVLFGTRETYEYCQSGSGGGDPLLFWMRGCGGGGMALRFPDAAGMDSYGRA